MQQIGRAVSAAMLDDSAPIWTCGGPSGGGCVLLAQALREVLGAGEFWGVWEAGEWVHAALKVGGGFLDGNGYGSGAPVLAEYDDGAELLADPNLAGARNAEAWTAGDGDTACDEALDELIVWLRDVLSRYERP